jgi:hypothetical protein
MRPEVPEIQSLAWATDIDVLPVDRAVERHAGYWIIRSPSNFLLFDDPPRSGDGDRWEAVFASELPSDHRSFAWDRTDAQRGAALGEFAARGYRLQETVALVATAAGLRPHSRANPEVEVRRLDPAEGADAGLWEQVIEIQVAGRDPKLESEAAHRRFGQRRLADLRALFRLGRGGWWVALEPGEEHVRAPPRPRNLLPARRRGGAANARGPPGRHFVRDLRRPRVPRDRDLRVARLRAG